MKLQSRHYVEGTDPAIYIGHRVIRRPNGQTTVSKTYHAEFTVDARQRSKSLGTSNKNVAIRAAHVMSEQLARGIETRAVKKISVQELVDAYLLMQEAKGHSHKTVAKYRHNLNEFAAWWQDHSG
jgi:hypothetical protein